MGMCCGQTVQTAPPAEVVLKGKVRDFPDTSDNGFTAHPHFYGSRDFQVGCSSKEQGVSIAQPDIDTTDDMGDTTRFKGDNRGPKLISPLDPRVAGCFAPVGRFKEWYNDRPVGDVNRPFLIDIHLTRNPTTGMYEYIDDLFFPIDSGKIFTRLGPLPPYGDKLSGGFGSFLFSQHNFGFTMELHTSFTYFKGAHQVFNFAGDDDVWVYFNGKRVIDLGGIHDTQPAVLNLDDIAASIGLQDSLVYPFDLFFAERHTGASRLHITTSLLLEPQLHKPILPPDRWFDGQISLTLVPPGDGVTLHFTTDGSTPTTASQPYSGPITLANPTAVKARAYLPNWVPSAVMTEVYTDAGTLPLPVADPRGGGFVGSQIASLSVPGHLGAQIRYTTDGSEPTEQSRLYTDLLVFAATTTLKARAYEQDWKPSGIMSETYALLAAGVRAVYVGFDGDGRIDGAVIRLDIPVAALPSLVRLVDPVTKAPLILESSHISMGAITDILIVRFPDRPFAEGAVFTTGPLGSFPNAPDSATALSRSPIRPGPFLSRRCPTTRRDPRIRLPWTLLSASPSTWRKSGPATCGLSKSSATASRKRGLSKSPR